MAEQNTTHPNAYRTEAEEKRQQATILLAQAKELDQQAEQLEKDLSGDSPAPSNASETTDKEEDTDTEEKSKKGFGKK